MPAELSFTNEMMALRKYWLKAKIFVSEHSNFSVSEIDHLEIVDFLLLLNECEALAEAKRKAWEK